MRDLTFYAPFDNPADPLKLNKGTGTLSFTRATTATYVHPTTGLITTAADNVLRVEANGALIEGARTNLALQSETLGNATNWVATTMTADNNTAVAPDGATTAETLTASGDNATLLQSYTGTVAAYTASYYLKRKTGTGAVQVSADNTTWTSCTINASTWTRCTDTRTVTVATYYHGIRLATNTDAVYAWGGDAELGAFASSYIPTTTAAVTRNKDQLTFAASGNITPTTSGTIAFSSSLLYPNTSIPPAAVFFGGQSNFWFYLNAAGNLNLYDGTNNPNIAMGVFSANQEIKLSVAFGDNTWTAYKDGSVKINSGAYANPNPATIAIGNTISDDYYLFGHIKNFKIWNRKFTTGELTTITTP
jgi:hypothetical protein